MLAAENNLINKIKSSYPYSTSHQASLFLPTKRRLECILKYPSWGLMFDELPKANHEASMPFHLWLQQGYTETHNAYFHLSVIRKLIASWSHTSWRISQWSIITRWVHLNVCPNSLTLQTKLIFWEFFIRLHNRSPWFDQVAERVEHRSAGGFHQGETQRERRSQHVM